jgi:hypothetical protein
LVFGEGRRQEYLRREAKLGFYREESDLWTGESE